ncbi:MAG: excinuclease ABC subunit UvrA [Candidatus Brocadiae bacterium]|nr:excinuclease ABC subunit UvrA [Candidatus Brocadiia bacterium]
MELDHILITGARQHNLKSIDVSIPKKKLVVVTGVSGSGKSSLAFDTLYAEGQRRYVESLSSYARQFLGQMEKPLYDHIRGIAPTISVEQKAASRNPRSTVGTVTEVHDYLRVLFARAGELSCWKCSRPVRPQSSQQIVDEILRLPQGTRAVVLAPMAENRKGTHAEAFAEAKRNGFERVRVNGEVLDLGEKIDLDKKRKHTIQIVVDRITVNPASRGRLSESVETALKFGKGSLILAVDGKPDALLSEHRSCTHCGLSFPELTPQFFSFNSPQGMCADCNGLGTKVEMDPAKIVPDHAVSLEDGAVVPWGKVTEGRSGWDMDVITAVLKRFRIPLDRPWSKLTKDQQKAVLFGTGDERLELNWKGRHSSGTYRFRFEGVVNKMLRKLKESSSEAVKRWASQFMSDRICPTCGGARLRREAGGVKVGGLSLAELCALTIREAHDLLGGLKLDGNRAAIAAEILKEIRGRLGFLLDVGLSYLSLDRLAPTLSGGESQRIRLASQIGSELTGVIYILDEPSIGLHQRDNAKLIGALKKLRDIGNSVIVVEHDREMMEAADWLLDFGPGAGRHGGRLVAAGTPAEFGRAADSLTAQYLSGRREIEIPAARRPGNGKAIRVVGARENNLKKVDVTFPLGRFVCVTGVSGAGKSTLVNQILLPAASNAVNGSDLTVGAHGGIKGTEHVDKVVDIDQSPIGRTPRSNPATYTKAFDPIRDFFALLPESKVRGFQPGRFSFNVRGGRCESCQGDGMKTVEMHFLADVFVPCEVCNGKRFNDATLEVKFRGKSIADILETTVEEALLLFANHPEISRTLQTLADVGLGYIQLGQPSPTLSGGEAQRVKLSRELAKRSTGRTLYVLDEPTTGLHFEDIRTLLRVLNILADAGNTVVVIEHNLDVIKTADWVIDLGPEGGGGGGKVIAEGTPEQVAAVKASWTGRYLAAALSGAAAAV